MHMLSSLLYKWLTLSRKFTSLKLLKQFKIHRTAQNYFIVYITVFDFKLIVNEL